MVVKISLSAAPVGDVMTPTDLGYSGIVFLCSAKTSLSLLAFSLTVHMQDTGLQHHQEPCFSHIADTVHSLHIMKYRPSQVPSSHFRKEFHPFVICEET